MKKNIVLVAIAAMGLALSGCSSLLDVLSKNATFQFSSDTAYDGQEMVIKRLGTCSYIWNVISGTQFCSIKVYEGEASKAINGQDSTAVATFTLSGSTKNSETVKVKTQNKLYPDNGSYQAEGEISVHKWGVRIKNCKTGNDITNGEAEKDEPYMAYLVDLETGKPIDKIVYNLAIGKGNRSEEAVEFNFPEHPANLEKLAADGEYPYNPNVALVFKIGTPTRAIYNVDAVLHSTKASSCIKFNL